MSHKNKTLATFLAATLGSIGIHRFYLHGKRDKWGWLHFITLPISIVAGYFYFGAPGLLTSGPLVLSAIVAAIEALSLGLMSDEKWDDHFNPNYGHTSNSTWILAIILVLTMAIAAFSVIAVLARGFDLLYTGGAYG